MCCVVLLFAFLFGLKSISNMLCAFDFIFDSLRVRHDVSHDMLHYVIPFHTLTQNICVMRYVFLLIRLRIYVLAIIIVYCVLVFLAIILDVA